MQKKTEAVQREIDLGGYFVIVTSKDVCKGSPGAL